MEEDKDETEVLKIKKNEDKMRSSSKLTNSQTHKAYRPSACLITLQYTAPGYSALTGHLVSN
jgi:hypothetical protein